MHLKCPTCGATATLLFPLSVDDFAAMVRAFCDAHEHRGGP